jgi:hypothetical protein
MGDNRNRNIMIAVAVLLILCCCCATLAGLWFQGDAIFGTL